MKELLEKITQNKVLLEVVDGKLKLFAGDQGISPDLIQEIKNKKQELIDFLERSGGVMQSSGTSIPKTAEQVSYPVSSAQYRLWVLSQFEEESIAYNMPTVVELGEGVDPEVFKKSVAFIAERHEILRTVFRQNEDGEVRQWILSLNENTPSFEFIDLSTNRTLKALEKIVAEDSYTPFDLENGPLLRLKMFKTYENTYVLYFNMHHIISDGWSMNILEREVMTAYEGLKNGITPKLDPLRIQYKDYTIWQLNKLSGKKYEEDKLYWLKQFGGDLPVFQFPSFNQRPAIRTNSGHDLRMYIEPEYLIQLKEWSNRKDGSLYMGLTTLLNALLYRYQGQKELIIGSPQAGRDNDDLEDQIGFYVKTMLLKCQIEGSDSFDTLFDKTRKTILEAYDHESFPLDKLIEELNLDRDLSRGALFDVVLNVENLENNERDAANELRFRTDEIIDLGVTISKFDLEFTFSEVSGYLSFTTNYNTDIYDRLIIERFMVHFKEFVKLVCKSPKSLIGELSFLTESEEKMLLEDFNTRPKVDLRNRTILDAFMERVTLTPNKVAVQYKEKVLTYQELDERSTQLAHYLRTTYEISLEDVIGVKQERSELMVISILGILKAGAAFVPIDPNNPQERIEYIEKESGCKVSLDFEALEVFESKRSDYSTTPVNAGIGPDNLAYVIYTSGSTGKPKGAMIEHLGMLNHIEAKYKELKIHENGIVAQNAPHTFDISVWQMLTALLVGGKTVIYDKEVVLEPADLAKAVIADKITTLELVPSYFIELLDTLEREDIQFEALEILVLNAETLMPSLVKRWLNRYPNIPIVNTYGATEVSDDISHYVMDSVPNCASVPVMYRPIQNFDVHIVDDNLQLVPIGVKGEILICGPAVGRGYINNEEQTKKSFLSGPIKGVTYQKRVYRTGDLGRYLPDGTMEFIGRKDTQIKIRGNRIELGEIEHALAAIPGIQNSKVIANIERQYLVGYYVSDKHQSSDDIKAILAKKLPAYMVPTYLVFMEEMPLTANGKIDKKALPDPEEMGLTNADEYVAPETQKEKILVDVWQEVLKRKPIGIKDNFYSLGGDSIKSIQVVSRLKQRGYELKIADLMRNPEIRILSKWVKLKNEKTEQNAVVGEVVLSPTQKRFFANELIANKAHHNLSVTIAGKGAIDKGLLEEAIKALVSHHDALRMRFQEKEGRIEQYNQPVSGEDYYYQYYDLADEANAASTLRDIVSKVQTKVNLSEGALLRVVHARFKEKDQVILVCHQLIIDETSWKILVEDLKKAYEQLSNGEKVKLPLKTASFKNWSLKLNKYGNNLLDGVEKSYWTELVQTPVPGFPVDHTTKTAGTNLNSKIEFSLDKGLTTLLQTKIHNVYNTEMTTVLLTALGWAINKTFGVQQSVIQLEGKGREVNIGGLDMSRTVGWFSTHYPFILDVSSDKSMIETLIENKEKLNGIPNKGISYGFLAQTESWLNESITPAIKFNYSEGLNEEQEEGPFNLVGVDMIPGPSDNNRQQELLQITGGVNKGEFNYSIAYSSNKFEKETIKALSNSVEDYLCELIKQLAEQDEKRLTPSDLTLQGLTMDELSLINVNNNVEDIYELSPLQEGMYYLWLLDQRSVAYFIQNSYRISGLTTPVSVIQKAYNQLVKRHAILRTAFSNDYGKPIQVVYKDVDSGFKYHELDPELTLHEKEAYIVNYREADRLQGFDLESPSQMRMHLIKVAEGSYEFIWSFHHILMDGWCMGILYNEFYQLIDLIAKNQPVELAPLTPYSDYINWLSKLDKKAAKNFWKNYLQDYKAKASVPFVLDQPEKEFKRDSHVFHISGDLFKGLEQLSSDLQITQNSFLQSVWGVLLAKYNNTNDVVFGAVVSGRPPELDGIENTLGLFINTVPVRVKFDQKETPSVLLKRVHEQLILSNEYHYETLAEISSGAGEKDLINHIMVFENFPIEEEVQKGLDKDAISTVDSSESYDITNYDFNITIVPSQTDLEVELLYDAAKYEGKKIKNIGEHFLQVIQDFITCKDISIAEIDYLTTEEVKAQDERYAPLSGICEDNVVAKFKQICAENPGEEAVKFLDRSYSYAELDNISDEFAYYLSTQANVQKGDFVAIKLARSEWQIIAVLGIMKCGAAYVPIDLQFPEARSTHIVQDAGCKIVVDSQFVEQFKGQPETAKSRHFEIKLTADLPAYVIYTSGSTGKPKGVAVSQVALAKKIHSELKILPKDITISTCMNTSYVFDVSLLEMFLALLNGGKVLIPNESVIQDPQKLYDLILEKKVSILQGTPTFIDQLVRVSQKASEQSVKLFCIGGESLNQGLVDRINRVFPEAQINNHYGPTEAVIDAIVKQDVQDFDKNVIGVPLEGVRAYIMDEQYERVSDGIIGELCIGGEILATAYLNNKEMTGLKFINNPFHPSEKLYCTGDLARILSNGEIEFIGRKDNQIKLRGFRIELDEIEAVLEGTQGVYKSCVVISSRAGLDDQLLAYITGSNELDFEILSNQLRRHLPNYMIPSKIILLKEFPLTTSGKIAKEKLALVAGKQILDKKITAPRTDLELKVSEIWKSVLEHENLGVESHFFEMGGHSLKLMRLSQKYQKVFGFSPTFNELYSNVLLEEHSRLIQNGIEAQQTGPKYIQSYTKFSIKEKNDILFIPPVSGSPLVFRNFAMLIEDDFNCYGIQYPMLEEANETSLVKMTEICFNDLMESEIQKDKIITIMGYSMGAAIAFEMAKLVEKTGMKCELILLDRAPNLTAENDFDVMDVEMDLNQFANANNQEINKEELEELKIGIINNAKILDLHKTQGIINANVTCIQSSDQDESNMKEWQQFSHGEFNLLHINASHYQLLETENSNELKKIILKR